MRNVVFTDTIERIFNTYKIEITSWEDDAGKTWFQTFVNGRSLLNHSETLDDAKKSISGRIWSEENLAETINTNPERFYGRTVAA